MTSRFLRDFTIHVRTSVACEVKRILVGEVEGENQRVRTSLWWSRLCEVLRVLTSLWWNGKVQFRRCELHFGGKDGDMQMVEFHLGGKSEVRRVRTSIW